MKHIRIASDLHLEAFYGRDEETLAADFLPADPRDAESMLILAGDISSQPEQLIRFISATLSRFEKVLFIPGNHEYYRQNYDKWNVEMYDALMPFEKDGLYFSTEGMSAKIIDGFMFIYGTMWGDGGPTLADKATTGYYLNDFRLIRKGDGYTRFTVGDMERVFRECKKSIEVGLEIPFEGKKIVVTHHLPSRRLVSERFWPGDGSDGANGGFVGQCDELIARTEIAPALWIHGHTHDSVDTHLWKTRIVCNPSGYKGEWNSDTNSFRQHGAVTPKIIALEEL